MIIYKKRKSPVTIISNKHWLGCGYLSLGEITKFYITKLKISMRNTYKILIYSQIGILTMKSYKTSFLLISWLYTYCPITIGDIRDKIVIVLWPDNGIYNLFNLVHRVLRLNYLAIKRNVVMNHL